MPDKGYILCVDDDLALLENLWQQILDLHGGTHEVVMAKSGEEALGIIYDLHHQGKTVQMVISDPMMPVSNASCPFTMPCTVHLMR